MDKKQIKIRIQHAAIVMLSLISPIVLSMDLPVAASADMSACTCADVRDMQSRRGQAAAATQAYINMLNAYTRLGSSYSQKDYNDLQLSEIKPAIDAYCTSSGYCPTLPKLDDPDANGPSNTSNFCLIYVAKNITPCLRNILIAHEEFHQRTCRSSSPPVSESVVVGNYWKERLGLRGSFMDEQQSYMHEIGLIDTRLAQLGACTNQQPATNTDSVLNSIKALTQLKAFVQGSN